MTKRIFQIFLRFLILLGIIFGLAVTFYLVSHTDIEAAKPKTLTLLILVIIALAFSIHIVPRPERWVVERLGDYMKTWEPGLHFLFPLIDRVRAKETLADQIIEIFMDESNLVEFSDASGTVNVRVLLKVVDPIKATYNVKDWRKAVEEKVDASTRKEMALLKLDEATQKNEEVSIKIKTATDPDIANWGLELVSDGVLITDIGPSEKIREEREKIIIAEKEKQANIIRGEGEAGRLKKIAEGLKDNPEAAAYNLTKEALESLKKATVVSVSEGGNISLPTKVSGIYEGIKEGMSPKKKEESDE